MLSTRMQAATFVPNYISDLELWLDAADITTIVEASDMVSRWNDKSGFGRDALQSSLSSQPVTNATTLNGRNVIDFSGSHFLVTDAIVETQLNSELFIVYQNTNVFPIGGTDVDILFRHENPNASDYTITSANGFIDISAPLFRRENGGVVTRYINSNANISDSIHTNQFFVARASASASNIYQGKLAIGATASGSFKHVGSIAEVIYYGRGLLSGEVDMVECYLAAKWGIELFR